jgi:hypothetical protein
MTDNIVRIVDYDRKSREPDAVSPRDHCDADVIKLPVIRRLNAPAPERKSLPSVFLPEVNYP